MTQKLKISLNNDAILSQKLLKWYDQHQRNLPWRSNKNPNPYHVLLSEFMLQQTVVKTVIPYFNKFIQKFPNLEALAQASQDQIHHLWQGLGYYRRADNLHKTAKIIAEHYDGIVPQNFEALKTLPGIGDYTAAAIASIAYNKNVVVIDGNIKRIMARLGGITTFLEKSEKIIRELAEKYQSMERFGDYAQSLMDLGSQICTPKNPDCQNCPIASLCLSFLNNEQHKIPVQSPKKITPEKHAFVFIIQNKTSILFEKRPSSGLLANLDGLPTTMWCETKTLKEDALKNLPIKATLISEKKPIKHVFSHFKLYLTPLLLHAQENDLEAPFSWIKQENISDLSLPTLMKKVLENVF